MRFPVRRKGFSPPPHFQTRPTGSSTMPSNRREAHHSPPSSAEVKNEWNCTAIPLVRHNRLAGRAIVQAVSLRLPIAAARVRVQVRSCGICGGQSGTGAGLFRVLRFPLLIIIPPTAPHSSSIIWGWYNSPLSGRRTKWTQSHPTPRN
jgi:hypothetical protein